MKSDRKQLKAKIVGLRDAIRRKYKAFKDGIQETDIMLEKQYKPIITELRKKSPNIKNDIKTEIKQEPMDEQPTMEEEEGEEFANNPLETTDDAIDFNPQTTSSPQAAELSAIVSTPSGLTSATQFIDQYFTHRLTKKYMRLFMSDAGGKSKVIDDIYGPRYENETLMIGNKALEFDNSGNIIIGNTNYGATPGVYELLFKRIPDEDLYDDDNLTTYKSILIASSAHKRQYNFYGTINRKSHSFKYRNVISKLFPPQGKGMKWKTAQSRDITHWDDPNELVDRLRHLAMSAEAGNGNHGNEIINITEELREAGYIKGDGNSRFQALLK